jgi:hypothetical protein
MSQYLVRQTARRVASNARSGMSTLETSGFRAVRRVARYIPLYAALNTVLEAMRPGGMEAARMDRGGAVEPEGVRPAVRTEE